MARYDDDRRYGRNSDRGDDRDRFGSSYQERDNDYSRERYSGRDHRDDESSRMRSDRMDSGRSRYGSDRGYDDGGAGSSRMRSGGMDDDRYGSDRGYGSTRSGDMGLSGSGSRGYSGMNTGRSGSMGYGSDRYGSGLGPHSGRGPEGYSRSSDRITEDVNEALTHHGGVDASKIRVSVEDGEVTLEGTVSSRREKRMAENAAEDARGVRDVHNRLRISSDDSDTDDQNSATASASGTSNSGRKAQKTAASS